MQSAWVEDICRKCADTKAPFFFKQWGGWNRKKAGRILYGKTWDAMPPVQQAEGAAACHSLSNP